MKIRWKIELKWASSLFVQLYKFIHCWNINGKNIANTTKLVKKLMQYLFVWGTNGRSCQDHIQIRGREVIDKPTNERKLWNKK